jgi:hypothetical protein
MQGERRRQYLAALGIELWTSRRGSALRGVDAAASGAAPGTGSPAARGGEAAPGGAACAPDVPADLAAQW